MCFIIDKCIEKLSEEGPMNFFKSRIVGVVLLALSCSFVNM